MAKIGDFDIRFQGADARFKFQVGNYPTFPPAWKAVLSVAMVAWDKVSGQFSVNINRANAIRPNGSYRNQ